MESRLDSKGESDVKPIEKKTSIKPYFFDGFIEEADSAYENSSFVVLLKKSYHDEWREIVHIYICEKHKNSVKNDKLVIDVLRGFSRENMIIEVYDQKRIGADLKVRHFWVLEQGAELSFFQRIGDTSQKGE